VGTCPAARVSLAQKGKKKIAPLFYTWKQFLMEKV